MTDKRLGGRRVLAISPEILVDFCKRHEGQHRTFTVENAIPDDARIVDGRIAWASEHVEVVLESTEWQDSSTAELERLQPPVIMMHYQEGEEIERLRAHIRWLEAANRIGSGGITSLP